MPLVRLADLTYVYLLLEIGKRTYQLCRLFGMSLRQRSRSKRRCIRASHRHTHINISAAAHFLTPGEYFDRRTCFSFLPL